MNTPAQARRLRRSAWSPSSAPPSASARAVGPVGAGRRPTGHGAATTWRHDEPHDGDAATPAACPAGCTVSAGRLHARARPSTPAAPARRRRSPSAIAGPGRRGRSRRTTSSTTRTCTSSPSAATSPASSTCTRARRRRHLARSPLDLTPGSWRVFADFEPGRTARTARSAPTSPSPGDVRARAAAGRVPHRRGRRLHRHPRRRPGRRRGVGADPDA